MRPKITGERRDERLGSRLSEGQRYSMLEVRFDCSLIPGKTTRALVDTVLPLTVFGAVASYVISDRFERKRIRLLALLVWALSLSAIGIIGTHASVAIFGFVAAFTIGLVVPTYYTYIAENFSNQMRPMSMAFTDGIGHLGAAAAPIILIGMTLQNAFLTIAASGLLTAALLLRSRNTKGRTLEELA
jgi:MFS family permease